MDDFSFESPELTSSHTLMEFGNGGRISRLWVIDPNHIGEDNELQTVMPNLPVEAEFTEDYYPGTILIGARANPHEPWIVSRNIDAAQEEGDLEPNQVTFNYEFAFLSEIRATGRFYEVQNPIPHVAWDVTITNDGDNALEIGELAFPMGFDNILYGFPTTTEGIRRMWREKFHIHKFIGGSGSYLHVQLLNGESPGLLVCPGANTSWEFYNHASATLTSSYRSEGVPIVYAHSVATLDREGWKPWFNGHTSAFLAPGESRTFQTLFAPIGEKGTGLHETLAKLRRPAFKLLPGAVAPASVGIAVEVTGVTPARFTADVDAELEKDSDEFGGFCFVKPEQPGALSLQMTDTRELSSMVHLVFTKEIDELIQKRADWILLHQVYRGDGQWKGGIAPCDNDTLSPIIDTDESGGVILGSLADTLFLAEKNLIVPNPLEIEALVGALAFIRKWIHNPGDHSVGSVFGLTEGVATNRSRAKHYQVLAAIYDAMGKLSAETGLLDPNPDWYRLESEAVLAAASTFADPLELTFEAFSLPWLSPLIRSLSPTIGEAQMLAGRSSAPSWWWYAGDKNWPDLATSYTHDKGEQCLSASNASNARQLLAGLRDGVSADELKVRLAFGGLLSVWALVQEDGAAADSYCPDSASRDLGMSSTTGVSGLALSAYLQNARSLVFHGANQGSLGCHATVEMIDEVEHLVIKPWDGVRQRIEVYGLGVSIRVRGAAIAEMQIQTDKQRMKLTLRNVSQVGRKVAMEINGLWGRAAEANGQELNFVPGSDAGGYFSYNSSIKPLEETTIEIKVIQ
ncbi:MAG: hypothetical protein JSS72_10175 [Armatimonadetes bacterium]|nr:hypothetical protein [Armatimonadota bacterium]